MDLAGYAQCHFFAGVGGWSYAARLAGWPDDRELWTGSCPCQPFSSAARGRSLGVADSSKHLWPKWFQLIAARRPIIVFGEQVASAHKWLDQVCFDLERLGNQTAAVVLPASGFGFDHERRRIYFASHADPNRQPSSPVNEEVARVQRLGGYAGGVVSSDGLPPRMAVIGAFGNSVVPQVAAEVIGAFLDAEEAA
jgi:DNA (cytosine-5)-methyltransferase 1